MTYKQSRAAALRAIKREIKVKGLEKFEADRAEFYKRLRREAAETIQANNSSPNGSRAE